jgi:hypothetical protein
MRIDTKLSNDPISNIEDVTVRQFDIDPEAVLQEIR